MIIKQVPNSIKEKLFGKSFDIQADFDAAIKYFIEQTENETDKKLLQEKTDLLKELFITAGYSNLRHLRQATLDFERFYDFLPDSAKKKPELIDHIISLFFSISFEIKKGDITEDDLKQLFDNFSKKSGEEKTVAQKVREKYSVFRLYHHPVSEELWTEFFKKGTLNKEQLKLSIENSIYFQQENTPNWSKLWHFYDMEDADFDSLFKLVYTQFEDMKIENIYELLQIIGMFVFFFDINLISYEKKTIIDIAKKNVENLKKTKNLKTIKHEDFLATLRHGTYNHGSEIAEVKDFIKFISDQINISQFEDYPKLATELLVTLSESIDEFGEKVILSNARENLYYDFSILNFIPTKKFVEVFLKLSNKDKKYLGQILEKRCRPPEFNSKLKDELPWLRELFEMLSKEKDEHKGKISGYIIEFDFLKSLNNSIKALE